MTVTFVAEGEPDMSKNYKGLFGGLCSLIHRNEILRNHLHSILEESSLYISFVLPVAHQTLFGTNFDVFYFYVCGAQKMAMDTHYVTPKGNYYVRGRIWAKFGTRV